MRQLYCATLRSIVGSHTEFSNHNHGFFLRLNRNKQMLRCGTNVNSFASASIINIPVFLSIFSSQKHASVLGPVGSHDDWHSQSPETACNGSSLLRHRP